MPIVSFFSRDRVVGVLAVLKTDVLTAYEPLSRHSLGVSWVPKEATAIGIVELDLIPMAFVIEQRGLTLNIDGGKRGACCGRARSRDGNRRRNRE